MPCFCYVSLTKKVRLIEPNATCLADEFGTEPSTGHGTSRAQESFQPWSRTVTSTGRCNGSQFLTFHLRGDTATGVYHDDRDQGCRFSSTWPR